MRIETKTIYYADDGSAFTNERACLDYEANCSIQLDKLLSDLYIADLLDQSPILFSKSESSYLTYQWFNIASEQDYKRLTQVLKDNRISSTLHANLRPPKQYPDIIAIELSTPKRLLSTEQWKYTGRYSYYNDEFNKLTKYIETMNKFIKGD